MIDFLKKSFSLIQKVFIVLAVYFVVVNLFLYFTSPDKTRPAVDPIKESRKLIYKKINDKQMNSTKEGRQLVAIYRSTVCFLIGEACTDNPSDGDKYFSSSAFGTVATLIALPYTTPPASGIYWVYDSLQKTGFVPATYAAQGIGFAGLQPLQDLWKIFRDAALLLIVVVVIAIGFMIMFRMKVNPQTVITLENSLPRLVITLLLIVFSFAIAGFLIDLMYLVTALGIDILSRNQIYNINAIEWQGKIFGGRTGSLFGQIFWNNDIFQIGPAFLSIMPPIVSVTVRTIVVALTAYLFFHVEIPGKKAALFRVISDKVKAPFIGEVMAFIIGMLMTTVLLNLVPFILSLLVLVFGALLVFFRIFFTILKAYLKILVYVIFAPIILLFEAIPGRKAFTTWFKNLIGELLVIPVTTILMLVSAIIVNIPQGQTALWEPPFIHNIYPKAFNVVIGIGILFLIPDFIKLAKESIGIKDQKGLNLGAGTFFGATGAVGGGALGLGMKYLGLGHQAMYWPEWMRNIAKKVPGVEEQIKRAESLFKGGHRT